MTTILASSQHCTQCDRERPVREVMGGNYAVLGFCGHVMPLEVVAR